jgi:Galactose oxidase-like, Early set domain/Ricin-type beta-trefoil lectin domain
MTTNRPSRLGRPNKVAIALTFAVGLAAAGGTGAAAVTSAPSTAATVTAQDPHSGAEHAQQDLVGSSITDIERQTRAAAAKIKDATGTAPGGHVRTQTVPNNGLSSAAAVDPGVGGAWSAVIPTDVVPIFQAMLPNGKVLMWDSVGDGPAESYTDHTFTRALVWDPETNTSVRRDVQGYNIFCAGYTQLADGRILVAGGNKDSGLNGIVQTHIFDWRTETWSRGPDMASGRWYPSVAALGNDEAVIVGGGPSVPEVFQTDGSLRRLTNASGYGDRSYPFLAPRPDGKVELVGPHSSMNTIDTSGIGAIAAVRSRDGLERDYGSFATYDIGKVLVAGGGNLTEGGQNNVPTKTAVVVDVNNGTTVSSTAAMSVGRRQANLTVLADGSVLATGGQSRSVDGLVDLDYPVFAAERWNPATGTWTVLASANRVREYHSSAALLPDGRVLTGGGGVCGTCATKGYLEKNIEYFEPPYLFRNDGSGQRAARPVIDSAPATAGYGQNVAIASAQASTIAKVGLVRLGAPTHSEDQGQRYVPLSFSVSGTTITATSPATSNIAPAGYYMLFVTDAGGVPSVAKIVKLERGAPTPPPSPATPIVGISGRCIDIRGGAAVNHADLLMNTCDGRSSQNWLYSTGDRSLRSLNKCMEVAGNVRKAGSRVQLDSCSGASAQSWDLRVADRTIRATSGLCLQPKAGSTALQATLEIATCKTGSAAQQWTW